MKTQIKYCILLIFIGVLNINNIGFCANRYWVGNGGNWSDINHWSASSNGANGASVPTSSDDVIFDANSFNSGSQTVTIDVTANCKSMDWTNAINSPTLAGFNSINVYGNVTFIAAMTASWSGSLYFYASGTLTTNGKTLACYIYASGTPTITLADNLTTTGYISISAGSFTSASHNISTSSFTFTSTGNLTLGTSTLTLTSTSGFVLGATSVVSAASATVLFTTASVSSIIYLNLQGASIGTVTLPSSGCHVFVDGSGTINNLNVYAGNTLELKAGITLTISGTLSAAGDCQNWINILSQTPGSTASIGGATQSISYAMLRDITYSGGGTLTANNCGNVGNNSGITFTNSIAGRNLYWIGDGTGTGNWKTGSCWTTDIGGASSGNSCAPNMLDNVFFNDKAFRAASKTVTINGIVNVNSVNFTGAVNAPTFTNSSSYYILINGALTLASNISFPGSGNVYFFGLGSYNITSNGGTINCSGAFFRSSATYTLADDAIINGNILIQGSTFVQGNNNLTVTGSWYYSAGTYTPTSNATKWVKFTGATTSYIENATTFYNVEVNKSSSSYSVETFANTTITRELKITQGIFNCFLYTNTIADATVNGGELWLQSGTNTITNDIYVNGGTLQMDGGTNVVNGVTSGGLYNINGITIASGAFNSTAGTLTVGDGTTEQLIISGGTMTTSGGIINITNQLTMTSGGFNQSGGTINLSTSAATAANKFSLTGGTYSLTGGILSLNNANKGANGDIYISNGTTMGTINALHTTSIASTNANAYINVNSARSISGLTINNSGKTALLTSATDLKGTLTLTAGTLDVQTNNMTIAGDFTNNGATFTPNSQTISMDGTVAQTIGGSTSTTFYNLTIANTNTTSLGINTSTSHNFLISSGGGFSLAGYTLNCAANFTNSSGTFTHANGTVNFNGTSTVTPGGTGVGNKFYNIILNGTSATLAGAITIENNITLTAGTWSIGGGNYAMYVNGNWINAGGSFTCGTGTVTFGGSSTQKINVTTAGGTTPLNADFTFYNAVIDGTDVVLYYNLGNSRKVNFNDVTINSNKQFSTVGQ